MHESKKKIHWASKKLVSSTLIESFRVALDEPTHCLDLLLTLAEFSKED